MFNIFLHTGNTDWLEELEDEWPESCAWIEDYALPMELGMYLNFTVVFYFYIPK